MSPLLLNPSVVLAASADEYLAYHVDSNRIYRLNPTAALFVELCDGTRMRDELLGAVAPMLPAAGATACSAWLDDAVKQGLLINGGMTPSRPPFSADELRTRAKRLRDQSRVLAAYICQRAATEMAPADTNQWYALGELAHIVGRREEARSAYERYFQSHPDDVEIQHLLIALRNDSPPPRASDDYIEQLYSYFAKFYDENMRGDLDFKAPDLLNAAFNVALPGRSGLDVLELGCGTGLFGQLLRSSARRLTGIDLSGAMIDRARRRDIYDHLEKAEITAWLDRDSAEHFDVIAACDTLIYFGDLRQVLAHVTGHLRPGGLVGFTVEKSDVFPFCLTDSGRFAHHRDHLLQVAQEAGMQLVSQTAEVLRYEYGEPVWGWVTVLRVADFGKQSD
jgi:predicted TPR repeat methyltransferase